MFPPRYFASRMFAPRYFPPGGLLFVSGQPAQVVVLPARPRTVALER